MHRWTLTRDSRSAARAPGASAGTRFAHEVRARRRPSATGRRRPLSFPRAPLRASSVPAPCGTARRTTGTSATTPPTVASGYPSPARPHPNALDGRRQHNAHEPRRTEPPDTGSYRSGRCRAAGSIGPTPRGTTYGRARRRVIHIVRHAPPVTASATSEWLDPDRRGSGAPNSADEPRSARSTTSRGLPRTLTRRPRRPHAAHLRRVITRGEQIREPYARVAPRNERRGATPRQYSATRRTHPARSAATYVPTASIPSSRNPAVEPGTGDVLEHEVADLPDSAMPTTRTGT